jgi:hypothetical protein
MDELRTYRRGETITVELDLEDESGVAEVTAFFRRMPYNYPTIEMEGHGGGEQHTTLELKTQVTEDVAPGEYYCDWIELHDVKGNETTKHGPEGLEFRIEDVPGDFKPPELKGSRLS